MLLSSANSHLVHVSYIPNYSTVTGIFSLILNCVLYQVVTCCTERTDVLPLNFSTKFKLDIGDYSQSSIHAFSLPAIFFFLELVPITNERWVHLGQVLCPQGHTETNKYSHFYSQDIPNPKVQNKATGLIFLLVEDIRKPNQSAKPNLHDGVIAIQDCATQY